MKTVAGSAVAGSAVAGIDVSKASLDVSVAAGPVRRFANTPEGIADLVHLNRRTRRSRSRNGRNCGICGGVGSSWWNSAYRS